MPLRQLTPDQRKILLDLIATDRDQLSWAQMAIKFTDITGRTISLGGIRRVARYGYRQPPAYEPEKYHARRLHKRIN